VALLQLGGLGVGFEDGGRQTGGTRLVVSGNAVADLDAHGTSFERAT